jgi:tripartite-type tricarboxylate transporter receptor subunit TctC
MTIANTTMTKSRDLSRRDAIASALAAAVFAPAVVRAQSGFPNRSIRIIVPVSPGGGVDIFARLIAAKIEQQRRVQFVVENRTGGNSTVGGLDVQRAAPDGYTVLFHASTHNMARLVMREVPYDPIADFTPIALAGEAPLIHIIANGRPERTVPEIVESAKAKPDDWSFATAQLGAPGHLAEVAFNQYNGLNIPIVVYRGTAPAANDVVGGHVPMMIEAILSLLSLVKAGSVRAVAVAGKKRSALAPDIPTHGGVGRTPARFRRLVGDVGTARHAGRSGAGPQRLGQRGGAGIGRGRQARAIRHRARRADAAAVRAIPQSRSRSLRQIARSRAFHAGVTAHCRATAR